MTATQFKAKLQRLLLQYLEANPIGTVEGLELEEAKKLVQNAATQMVVSDKIVEACRLLGQIDEVHHVA